MLQIQNLPAGLLQRLAGLPLFLNLQLQFFQLPDAPAHTYLADISAPGIQLRIDILQFKAVVLDTVPGNADSALPQPVNAVAFHHVSQQEINICAGIRNLCQDFLRQSALLRAASRSHNPFRIQYRHAIVFLLIQFLIKLHCRPGIFRLHDQEQLIAPHISFNSISPCIIPDIQQIRQDFHRNIFPVLLF